MSLESLSEALRSQAARYAAVREVASGDVEVGDGVDEVVELDHGADPASFGLGRC